MVNDKMPETPGEIATPVPTGTDNVCCMMSLVDKERTRTDTDERAEPKVDVTPRSVVLADFNKMLKEIEISEMLQQEQRKTDPNLASASSFLNVVTGGRGRKKEAKPVEVAIEAAESIRRNAEMSEVVRPNAEAAESVRRDVEQPGIETVIVGDPEGVSEEVLSTGGMATTAVRIGVNTTAQRQLPDTSLEQQRATRITAAKSLLRDELRKPNPSPVSLAAFRQAAYGDGGIGESKSSVGRSAVEEDKREEERNDLSTCVRPTDDN